MERCGICHFNAGNMNLTFAAVSGLTSTHSLNFLQRRLTASPSISGSGFWFLSQRKEQFFHRSSSVVTADFSKPFCVNTPFNSQDQELLPWIGPVPGDIAEVEAYCRIFRAAEGFHNALMEMLCNPLTGECYVSYDLPSGDSPSVEDKIVSILGCMICLMKKGKGDILAGRFTLIGPSPVGDVKEINDMLPPLARFRGELKTYCESLCAALEMYLAPAPDDDRSRNVWRKLQRLMNVCYDSGHIRRDNDPCHTLFANWNPVYLPRQEDDFESSDSEVAFFTGSQVTVEGLEWLIGNGFKTIIDLRAEAVTDNFYESALKDAIVSGKVELVKLPVEVGSAPSMEQVKQFASLVSKLRKNSVYLHSKEGVWRTSAMVSRWKQYVVRSSSQLISYQIKTSAAPIEDAIITEQLSSSTFGDEKDKKGAYIRDDSVHDATSLTPDIYRNVESCNFQADGSPFESQIPSCNVFSKKDISLFLRDKKIHSRTNLTNQHRRLGLSHDLRESYDGTLSRSEVASTSPELKPIKSGNINGCKTSTRLALEPLSYSTNNVSCLPNKSHISCSHDMDELHCQVTEVKRSNNDASMDSRDDGTELNGGHMCASATGVVRLQSRKKAELFLVRTDGFSCIREQVSESSLAFTHPSTQQQMLMWKSLPKTVLLLKKLGKHLIEEAKEISSFLYHEEKMNVLVEPELHDIFASIPGFGFIQTFYSQDISNLHERIDFVACLGGDGVILHASNLFIGAVPPVISFNLGSLGFLTAHHHENYRNDLTQLIHGNSKLDGVYITLRMRLRCEIFRKGEAMAGKVFDVLNEVVVERGSNPYLSKIECYEQERLITKVQGDGVIVATPTGSTAYSTAAGGSMVHPNVPCMLFTPICPHSLSFRPVILPDSAMLELKIPDDARSNAWVSFDGKRRQQLSRGDSVRICTSQHPLPTVNKSDQTCEWFHSLIRCLNWNERLDQKAF